MSSENNRVDRADPEFSRYSFFKNCAISTGSSGKGRAGLTEVCGDATDDFLFGELSDATVWLTGDGTHSKIITGWKRLALDKAK